MGRSSTLDRCVRSYAVDARSGSAQTVRTTIEDGSTPLDPSKKTVAVKKMSFLQTLRHILRTDGAHERIANALLTRS